MSTGDNLRPLDDPAEARRRRIALHVTQGELAEIIGVHRNTLRNAEDGKSVGPWTREKLLQALDELERRERQPLSIRAAPAPSRQLCLMEVAADGVITLTPAGAVAAATELAEQGDR